MLIIHYSEIGLKGGNREYFENKLIENIRTLLITVVDNCFICKKIFGRLLVDFKKDLTKVEIQSIKKRLGDIFGIANFSFVKAVEADIDLIEKEILKDLKKEILIHLE